MVQNDFLVNTRHWEELIMHNIIHDGVMSDLTVLSVLSSVRHLGTCWPLEWAFFSISMFFLHSSASFSYLWRQRHVFTGSHRRDLCILSWEEMRSTRAPGKEGKKTTLHWPSMNKRVLKVTPSLVVITCSMEINKHLSPQSLGHTAHDYKILTAAQAFLSRQMNIFKNIHQIF